MIINILIIAVSIALFIVIVASIVQSSNEKKTAALKVQKEREVRRAQLIQQAEADYSSAYNNLIKEHGAVTNSFLIGIDRNKTSNYLYIFEDSRVISLFDEIIPFKDILEFSLQDDAKTIMTNTSYVSETSTNTGSMLGRAAVGGFLLGGVGTVIGATSAKKTTTTTPIGSSTTTTTHKYTIYLNVNSLSNPIREISLGQDTKTAQTVANIFNIIINRNKQ
jgi:hypothetical protein